MEWFEKEYKKRFEDESTLDGVESGALWDQISQSIPQEKLAKRPPYWKWTLLMMAFAGIITSLILIKEKPIENDNQLAQSEAPHLSKVEVEDNGEKDMTEVESLIAKDQIENIENKVQDNTIIEANNESEVLGSNEVSSKKVETILSNDKKSIRNEKNTDLNLSSNQNIQNHSKHNNTNTELLSSGSENSIDEKNLKIDNGQIGEWNNVRKAEENNGQTDLLPAETLGEGKELGKTLLSSTTKLLESETRPNLEIYELSILKSYVQSKSQSIESPSVTKFKKPIIEINRKNPWAINIYGGANFFNLKYKDDTNSEDFAVEANGSLGPLQIGNSFGISLEYQLSHNWSISSGLEYNNYENKLSTIWTLDTMVLDDLQILRDAIKTRSVNHHNKLSTLSIPVSFTYDHNISTKWSLGASVGASYSIVRSQRGRFLNRDKIITDYDDDNNSQFTNFLSYRVNPYLRYNVSNHFSLNFNAGFSYQNHDKGQSLDLTRSSMLYNFGVGLRYKL